MMRLFFLKAVILCCISLLGHKCFASSLASIPIGINEASFSRTSLPAGNENMVSLFGNIVNSCLEGRHVVISGLYTWAWVPNEQARDLLNAENMPFWSLWNVVLTYSVLLVGLYVGAYHWVDYSANTHCGQHKGRETAASPPMRYAIGCMFLIVFFCMSILLLLFNDFVSLYRIKNIPYLFAMLGTVALTLKYHEGRIRIENSYIDEESIIKSLNSYARQCTLLLVLAPLAIFEYSKIKSRMSRNPARYIPPDGTGAWKRLNRDTDQELLYHYLDAGQRMEETVGARMYEIWINKNGSEVVAVVWEESKAFQHCPACSYNTYSFGHHEDLKGASYTEKGLRQYYSLCAYCGFRVDGGRYAIPTLDRKRSPEESEDDAFDGGSSGGGGA